MSSLSIVGLGPSDERLLTLGALEALRAAPRTFTCDAPPALLQYLRGHGIKAEPAPFASGPFLRGVEFAVREGIACLAEQDTALGVVGHPLLDVAGLPQLLRALDEAGIAVSLVPGVPRSALSATAAAPLVPLPAAEAPYTWEDLVALMARLRACCPWDREQTHASLLPYLLEEAHEVVEAVDENDPRKLREELGDLLLQIVFHAQLAAERGLFTVADVIQTLAAKLIRRHPHVFGDTSIATAQDQMKSWELLKTQEDSIRERASLLDGVPASLPALVHAQRLQEKAQTVGFDWSQARDVLDKITEELAEWKSALEAGRQEGVREELGDVLFSLVNLARRLGVDAEAALRHANAKFRRRFAAMEEMAGGGSRALANRSLADLDALWEQAKKREAGQIS